MLAHQIILAVFAAFLSQGNVASALPQGKYNTRSERLSSSDIPNDIQVREIKTTGAGDVSTSAADQQTDLVQRGVLVARVDALGAAGIALGGTGIIATIGFSEPGIKSAKWVYKHAVSAALATGQGLKEFPGDVANAARDIWHSHYFNHGQGSGTITSEAALEAAITAAGGIALVAVPAAAHTESDDGASFYSAHTR